MDKNQLLKLYPNEIREILNQVKKIYDDEFCRPNTNWEDAVNEVISEQTKPEWEALELRLSTETRRASIRAPKDYMELQAKFDQGFTIHSVRYRDEVFTVGGKARLGGVHTIQGFEIDKINGCMLIKLNCLSQVRIDDVAPVPKKQPIFTTNGDNEPVFEGERYYVVTPDKCSIVQQGIAHKTLKYHVGVLGRTLFKSEEKAEEYLVDNYRGLSVADVTSNLGWVDNGTVQSKLRELIKERIK